MNKLILNEPAEMKKNQTIGYMEKSRSFNLTVFVSHLGCKVNANELVSGGEGGDKETITVWSASCNKGPPAFQA